MWIASGVDEEQYKGRTASRGSVLGWCDELLGGFSRLSLSVSWEWIRSDPDPDPDALPCGWLVLFIGEGPGPLPNIEREGRQQLAILKGNI